MIQAMRPLAAIALLTLCACAPAATATDCPDTGQVAPEPPAAEHPLVHLDAARIVDLSHDFGPDTLYWPTSPSTFELEQLAHGETEAGYFYSANSFCSPEHGGTHLDAPIHFGAEGWAAHEIPAERLVAPAVVIDVREQAAADRDYRLGAADLEAWEASHGAVPAGAIVLVWTGWDQRYGDRKAYFGDDTPGDASQLHFPSYGLEAARVLVEDRGALGLGLDTPSLDYGPSTDFPVHQLVAAHNVYGLENLRDLGELPATGAVVIALPMKIRGGSGGPLRAIALVP